MNDSKEVRWLKALAAKALLLLIDPRPSLASEERHVAEGMAIEGLKKDAKALGVKILPSFIDIERHYKAGCPTADWHTTGKCGVGDMGTGELISKLLERYGKQKSLRCCVCNEQMEIVSGSKEEGRIEWNCMSVEADLDGGEEEQRHYRSAKVIQTQFEDHLVVMACRRLERFFSEAIQNKT